MHKADRRGGRGGDKWCVARHTSRMTRRAANACEKAFETATRREGHRAVAEGVAEVAAGKEE